MRYGTHKGIGSDIYKRMPFNLDHGSFLVLEELKKMNPGSSYSEVMRTVLKSHGQLMLDNARLVAESSQPNEDTESEEAKAVAEKLEGANLIGKVFRFPEDYKPGVYVKVCPNCNGNDFYEDVLTWNCNDCMWAGQVDYVEGNTTIRVTHKMKRKYPRDAA